MSKGRHIIEGFPWEANTCNLSESVGRRKATEMTTENRTKCEGYIFKKSSDFTGKNKATHLTSV